MIPDVKLNEFDKDEWWDVCQRCAPHVTREQFDKQWEAFCEMKRKKALQ